MIWSIKMLKKLFVSFSYIFHPVFISFYAVLFSIYFGQKDLSSSQKFDLLFYTILYTFCIPIAFIYVLKVIKKANSVMLYTISERKIPLFFQLILTFVLFQKIYTIDYLPEIHYFFVASFFSIFIAFVFLFLNIKTSLHLMAASGLLFFEIVVCIQNNSNIVGLIAVTFLVVVLVAISRLVLKAHTLQELFIGFLVGGAPQFLSFYF